MKVGVVAGGYVAAIAIAWAGTAAYITFTPGVDRYHSQGMSAFGDGLVFLAMFAVAAAVPTGAALFFLRPYRRFWIALSVAALVIAATGAAAALGYVAGRVAEAGTVLSALAMYGILRILVAPMIALTLFVCAVFAPSRSARFALLAATAVESSAFTYVAFTLFR
jgi:hypothetical protein